MKTNTYRQFKNYVIDNCVNKLPNKDYQYYTGDSAHLIYSAWYVFKHRLNEEECLAYLNEDYDKTRKHFYSHGAYAYVELVKDGAVKELGQWNNYVYKPEDIIEKYSTSIEGGDGYERSRKNWIEGVMKFYNFWKNKLDLEIAEQK